MMAKASLARGSQTSKECARPSQSAREPDELSTISSSLITASLWNSSIPCAASGVPRRRRDRTRRVSARWRPAVRHTDVLSRGRHWGRGGFAVRRDNIRGPQRGVDLRHGLLPRGWTYRPSGAAGGVRHGRAVEREGSEGLGGVQSGWE
jgi:hypothetical protein